MTAAARGAGRRRRRGAAVRGRGRGSTAARRGAPSRSTSPGRSSLGLLVAASVDGDAYALLGVGFCGGLTTYSSFAVQTARLRWRGVAYAAATVVLSLAAVVLGHAVG